MNIPYHAEVIFEKNERKVTRAKIIGGWLVDTMIFAGGNMGMTTKFISDPSWTWEI